MVVDGLVDGTTGKKKKTWIANLKKYEIIERTEFDCPGCWTTKVTRFRWRLQALDYYKKAKAYACRLESSGMMWGDGVLMHVTKCSVKFNKRR